MHRNWLFTIGHSTRPIDDFIHLLKSHGVQRVVDVRTLPRSRFNPHFDITGLPALLRAAHIHYTHLPGLGGQRRPRRDSPNVGWRNKSVRGYVDLEPAVCGLCSSRGTAAVVLHPISTCARTSVARKEAQDMFDTIVNPSSGVPRPRWTTTALSAAGHVVVLIALVLSTILATDVLPLPQEVITFVSVAPPPAPPPPPPVAEPIAQSKQNRPSPGENLMPMPGMRGRAAR